MYSSPTTPKGRRAEPVFKTPMSYSPHVKHSRLQPSPSRVEVWRHQLGLDDDSSPVQKMTSSDSDEENQAPNTPQRKNAPLSEEAARSPCTMAEYTSLCRQLDDRNNQRDELLLKVKTFSCKTKHYKDRLEREEVSKRQQLGIMRKAHEQQLQERDRLIHNLRDVIEEQQLRSQSPCGETAVLSVGDVQSEGTVRLVDDVKRLQMELTDLQDKLNQCQQEHDDRENTLQATIDELRKEKHDLKQQIVKLQSHVQSPRSGQSTTDNEKQLEKLQLENDSLVHQLVDLKKEKAGQRINQGSKVTEEQMELMSGSLQEQMSTLQADVDHKLQELVVMETKYNEERLRLSLDNQQLSKAVRDLKAQIMELQARSPEVVTRIQKVPVENEKTWHSFQAAQTQNAHLEQQVSNLEQQLSVANTINAKLEGQVSEFTTEIVSLNKQISEEIGSLKKHRDSARSEAEIKFRTLRIAHQKLCLKLELLMPLLNDVKAFHHVLKQDCMTFPQIVQSAVGHVAHQINSALYGVDNRSSELLNKYQREQQLRKRYHNELVELRGNIRVFCRVRPRIREDGTDSFSVITYDNDDSTLLSIFSKGRQVTFEVDRVFTEESTQEEVFNDVQPLIASCVDGYSVCIFAYGQTGSGKTYTMEGNASEPGINQRALADLFAEISERHLSWEFYVSVSVIEIYNETLRDLLSIEQVKLEVKMNPDGGLHVPGLTQVHVESVRDVYEVFAVGQRNRATAATNLNEHSSRSHALLCVSVAGVNTVTGVQTIGKLHLVDLAGSERVSRSGADGARLKEAQNINKSLSSLGDVISALRVKQSHIPYRNSKLTYFLQESLGGDSKTLMVVQVSPIETNVAETLCSLNFAQRVRAVELGTATRRTEPTDEFGMNLLAANSPRSPQVYNRGTTPSNLVTAKSMLSPANIKRTPKRK